MSERNDLSVVTPPPTHSESTLPTTGQGDDLQHPPFKSPTPVLSGQGVSTTDSIANIPQEHSNPASTSTHPTTSPLNDRDVLSSTYPPSTVTGSDRDATAPSEVSSSIPGRPPATQQHTLPMATAAIVTESLVGADVKGVSGESKDKDVSNSPSEKPRSLRVEDHVREKEITVVARPAPGTELQAPDRRYHSRARLDSLEDRNNLDTDSELQSVSESSEKESDTEDYPGVHTSRRRLKRSTPHERSFSISSSEDDDPFPEERNDLSVVSSPEHELPPGDDWGEGFGVSLSADITTTGFPDRRTEINDLSTNDVLPGLPHPQPKDVVMDELAHEGMLEDNGRVETGLPLDTIPSYTEHERELGDTLGGELNDLTEPQDTTGGGQAMGVSLLGKRSVGPSSVTVSEVPGQPVPLTSGQENKFDLNVDKRVKSTSENPSFSNQTTAEAAKHHQSMLVPQSEEEPARAEPMLQVTRTSDQVMESASYSTSSSDQLQPPVRKSFASLPSTYTSRSLQEDRHLEQFDLEMPTSVSAPPTGLQTMLDQPPPPFTHYAAPPPIFTAHVLEESVVSSTTGEETDVLDNGGREYGMDIGNDGWYHSNSGMGTEHLSSQGHDVFPPSAPVHRPPDEKSTGSHSHLLNSLDNPPTVGCLL